MSFLKSVAKDFSVIFMQKQKYLHSGQKLLYLGIIGLEFEKKNIAIFEINTLKLLQKQRFLRK